MRKKSIFSCLFIVFCSSVYGQSLGVNFNSTASGRNVTVNLGKNFSHSSLQFGVGYNINKITHNDDQNKIYFKRIFATKPIHRVNFDLTYRRYILQRSEVLSPYVFFNTQVKFSTSRNRLFIVVGVDSVISENPAEQPYFYKEFIEYFGPFTWLENTIGIGLNVKINERFFLNQKIGGGVLFIFGEEPKLIKREVEWEFAGLFNVGISYKLKGKLNN